MVKTSRPGFNLIGYVSAPFGIGVAARNTVTVLTRSWYDVAIVDLPLEGGRSGIDRTFEHLCLPKGARLPYPITLFHVNPRAIAAILAARPPWLPAGGGLSAAVPFWELAALPESWRAPLQAMDVILCPSRFIEHSLAAAMVGPGPAIRHFAQTVFSPPGVAPARARFGLPEKSILFVISFDAASDLDRKNPWAAIEAFNEAFIQGEDACLVIKVSDSLPSSQSRDALSRLREAAAAGHSMIINESPLSYAEVLSLYASCDVYVSLHRSEGLGLGPMEAMLLGKPVIATGWSGNTEFMDDGNACLVGSTLREVQSPVYRALLAGKPAVWAEPSIDDAVFWMRRLYVDEKLRAEIGGKAREDMETRREECLKGRIFEEMVGIYKRKMME